MTQRALRFVASCATGIIGGIVATFVISTQNSPTSPIDGFVADFDRNIQNAPIEASIVARDPDFRARVISATAEAYANGGWSAANDVLDAMMLEKQPEITWTLIHADDPLVVALWQRYLDAMSRLRAKPGVCRYYVSERRGRDVSFPSARGEYRAAHAAANAAFTSGAKNLNHRTAPQLPSQDAANDLLEKSTALGKPYSEDESAALSLGKVRHEREVSDTVACAAQIKYFENILALPEPEAAALIRYQWGHGIAAEWAGARSLE
jgi:hypothetical protein